MAYVPPPPGSVIPGQPTPEGVPKQSVHIADLPPEVRKSFLLSMVFFPTLVGATICLVIFLGYWTLFRPKEPAQFARELNGSDTRRRWLAARELAENIPPADPALKAGNPKIYDPVILTALINILENKELDKEAAYWAPTSMIKKDDEGSHIRWWAAPMVGHFAAKMNDPIDKQRGLQALLKALEEPELGVFAARGLTLLKDPAACDALVHILESNNPDSTLQASAAVALGGIGEYAVLKKSGEAATAKRPIANWDQLFSENPDLQAIRDPLRKAFVTLKEPRVLDNVAIALARMKDSSGRERLVQLKKDGDAIVRDHAQRALELLDTPLSSPAAAIKQ